MTQPSFPDFDDLKATTITFTAMTNLSVEIDRLFRILPITPYVVTQKKRGRKKVMSEPDPNRDVKHGSIITLKYEGEVRGVELRPRKEGRGPGCFHNSISVVMLFDKPVNFKVCANGTFQLTGCKSHHHALLSIRHLWEYVREHRDVWSLSDGDSLEILLIPVMYNVRFSVGFLVDRIALNDYVSERVDGFRSLFEESFGYAGVNVKLPSPSLERVMKFTLDEDGRVEEGWVACGEREASRVRYNTFLVFHSGNVIMSGVSPDLMREAYQRFTSMMESAVDVIEERLES